MGSSLNEFRREYFEGKSNRIRHLPCGSLSSIYMKHSPESADQLVKNCQVAWSKLTRVLADAIGAMAQDASLEDLVISHYKLGVVDYTFPENEIGAKASAISDVACLLVSIDPEPFVWNLVGGNKREVLLTLNRNLLDLAIECEKDWLLTLQSPTPLFRTNLSYMQNDQTIRIMFHTVCKALWPEAKFSEPYDDAGARLFAKNFQAKAWPLAQLLKSPSDQACASGVAEIYARFQEWWFSVGKTQVEPQTDAAIKRAESIFSDIRSLLQETINARHISGQKEMVSDIIRRAVEMSSERAGGKIFADAIIAVALRLPDDHGPTSACPELAL